MERKRGETYKQLLARAANALDSTQNEVHRLKQILEFNNKINPRTGNSYQAEAQFMFTSFALIEAEIRGTDCNELVLNAVRETLEQLGFNLVDQYENKCLKDGVY